MLKLRSSKRSQRRKQKRACPRVVSLKALLSSCVIGAAGLTLPAQAYIGDSFLEIPGVTGSWQGKGFESWIHANAMYWPKVPMRVFSALNNHNQAANASFAADRMTYGGPGGPVAGGPNTLVVSLEVDNPDAAALAEICGEKKQLPEMTYAESSENARPVLEAAPRPETVPEFWLYKFRNARITTCPIVDGAPDRAFVFEFEDVEWVNWDGPAYVGVDLTAEDYPNVEPAAPAQASRTKAFVISWFGLAGDVSDDQCPVMNERPSEDDYYAFMSEKEAAVEREKNGEKGVDYGRQMGFRGPDRLSVVNLPGIIQDPGFAEPVSNRAFGVNLDGSADGGASSGGSCAHGNYTSVDGKLQGVDNQLYRVVGCFSGFRGKKGYRNQTSNARRSDGNIVTLIEISDIDDAMNDDDVTVKIIHSTDKPLKDAAGKEYLPYSTFTPTDEPQFKYYNRQFAGRIEDGVIVTEAQEDFTLNTGLQDPLLKLEHAQLRLTIQPDENLKGVLGGYMDWRRFMSFNRSSYSENLFGFQAPGLYNALMRNADGMVDPVTGDCEGISAAYEIEAVPAFLVAQLQQTVSSAKER